MDGVTNAIFLASITVVAEIVIKKKGYGYVVNGLIIKKRFVNSESRNFLIKGFYRKSLESMLIGIDL